MLAGEGREDLWGRDDFLPDRDIERWGLEQAMKEAGVVSLLAKRLLQMTAGWVAGLTICSPFFLAALPAGAECAFPGPWLSHIGKASGTSSVSLALFPQGVIYGITWAVLAGWAGGREHRLHLAAFFLLLLFTAAGALLEGIFHHP
mgnify:CR=1 FL=1